MTDAAYKEIERLEYRTIILELREFKLRGKDDQRVVKASLSSEDPVERGGFTEVLIHGKTNVVLRRAQDGLPLLADHDVSDLIGVIEGVHIKGGDLSEN